MGKLKICTIICVMLLSLPCYSEPITVWTKTFGGSGGDEGYSVDQTTDGGYIITGYTLSYGAGGADVWLIKTDANGDTLWTKTFGGSDWDRGYSVKQTADGGYIITGCTSYGAGGGDVWLIKTDANGDTLWTKTFGGCCWDRGNSVDQTADGGYIITGWISYEPGETDVWLIKTDANGDTLWTKTFGGSGEDMGNSVDQTTDGGYIITGYTLPYGAGGGDVWLIKTDANGDTLWTKTFGGSGHDEGYSVKQTADGGYIIAGYTWSYGAGGGDVWLIKTDANGDTLWTKTFGGSGHDEGYSVKQTADGGYIITGCTWSYGAGGGDVWLIKTDANGDTLWTKTFGGSCEDRGYSVKQTADGGYIITGYTWSYGAGGPDVWLIKLSYIILTSPNGGELLQGNSTYNIIWRKPGSLPDSIKIWYSTDGGNSFPYFIGKMISPGVNDTSLPWNTPDISCNEVKIKIEMFSSGEAPYCWDISNDNFTIDSDAPQTFSLISPTDNAMLSTTTPTFIWHKSVDTTSGIKKYELWVDSVLNRDNITDTFTTPSAPLSESTHSWFIVAEDSAGNRRQSNETWSFEIDTTVPQTFSLISPTDSAMLSTTTPTFIWHKSVDTTSGIKKYELWVDSVLNRDNITDTFATPSAPLSEGMYSWFIVAEDSAGNRRQSNETWSFEIDTTSPITPTLILPPDSSWLNNLQVIFKWTGVTKSPVRYILQIDTVNTFNAPIIDTTELTEDTVALLEKKYYWRVKSFDLAGNESNFSSPFFFQIDTTVPQTFSLISPTDSAMLSTTTPTFIWHKSVDTTSGIKKYELWVDSVLNRDNITDTFATPSAPLSQGTHSWFIVAEDSAGNRKQSNETWSFEIEAGIKEVEVPPDFIIRPLSNPSLANHVIIKYGVPEKAHVSLIMYDLSGRIVKTLYSGEQNAGYYTIKIQNVSEGIYFIQIKVGTFRRTVKIIII